MSPDSGEIERARPSQAARTRAAVELYSRHEAALRRTARRFSLCADDADDALQRALEILIRKAPTTDPRELIRWTQTVVRHEALAVRRERERILSGPAAAPTDADAPDWISLIPSDADGPAERAERSEAVARSREALRTLKPQELRALSLLAEGYSYREIGEITSWSRTKINRCLAEGRERFRSLLARSADGRRCAELRPRLSAFCDGELEPGRAAELREHLRACANCRATLRAYRAAPAAVAALAPAAALDRSLLERANDLLAGFAARFGSGGEGALPGVAGGGGTGGAGMTAVAKAVALCVGSVGATAACVAGGFVPVPLELAPDRSKEPRIERSAAPLLAAEQGEPPAVEYETAPPQASPPSAAPEGEREEAEPDPASAPPKAEPAASGGAVEYAPPPERAAASSGSAGGSGSSGADPAGEFGP